LRFFANRAAAHVAHAILFFIGTLALANLLVLRPRNGFFAGAVATGVKAGAAIDGDITNPTDGMIRIDSTNGRIYVRYSGAWHYAALT